MTDAIRGTENFLSASGLNLSVPISKDQGRALVMLNWRPDRLTGRLRSRLGHGTAIDTFPASVHTIWLNQGSTRYIGAGTVLYRGTSLGSIVTGLDGRKLFLASTERFVWIMNRNAQRKDDGSTVNDWWIAPPATAPTVALGAAGVLNGTSPIVYYVSYENSNGHESSVGLGSTALVFTNQQAAITAIPLGPAGTSKRYLYRIGAGLTQAYRVATLNNNTATTYTDNEQNELAQARGILAALNREAPPAARGVCPYLTRLVAWNTAAFPNRIYYTPARQHWYFPSENYQPVGDFGEEILACTEINGSLYVLKERSVWRVVGDPANGNVERVTTEIGLPSELAIVFGRSDVGYLSRKGVFLFDGDRPKKLSGLVDPLFNGEGLSTGSGDVALAINLGQMSKGVLEISDGHLYASIPGGAATANSQTLVFNMQNGEVIQDNRGFTAMSQEGVSGSFVAAIGTALFYMDNGQTDAGVGIRVNYQSSFNLFGAPDNDKQVFELRIRHTLNAQTVSIKILFDEDLVTAPTFLVAALTGNGETRYVFNVTTPEIGRLCRSLSVMVEGVVTAEIEIEEIAVTYFVHPRKTKVWISGVLNDRQTSMYEARQIQAEFDAGTGDVTLKLLTDGDASADMAAVESLVFTVTGTPGRRTIPVMLTQIRPGRLWQASLTSASEVRGYTVAVEMRRVPVFLSGARNQFLEEQPISLGG